ncbi:MotA/TolQ/ExbB proton channel family protein [Chryseolinea sp. T2]|uniref:MotA/TolQ/ExbB proton channel family protein n=1 Tax=Chryseolinea sp. T2 TaxID=3129255 RepID=UPI00307733A9
MLILAQIAQDTVSVTPSAQEGLSLLTLVMKGGAVMIPIVILWIIATYIFIERYLYLRQKTKRQKDFLDNIIRMIKGGDVRGALHYADKDETSTGRILLAGLQYIGKPIKEIETMMESVANIEVGEMEKNTSYLGIIAGVAPMLGFIGTISGIINIFYSISLTDNISIGIIAGGLYEKMVTSGAGLIVGVCAYAAYHILNQLISKFTLRVQRDSLEFIRYIVSPVE